jgi:hypothetical protein
MQIADLRQKTGNTQDTGNTQETLKAHIVAFDAGLEAAVVNSLLQLKYVTKNLFMLSVCLPTCLPTCLSLPSYLSLYT